MKITIKNAFVAKLKLVKAVKELTNRCLREAKDYVDLAEKDAKRAGTTVFSFEPDPSIGEEKIKAELESLELDYTIVPTKDRPYLAKFKNGAEFRFFAPGIHAAEKVAESRAKELETDVEELIETSKNVPTTKVIKPWVGTRFEANEEGSITMVVHFATPKMPQIRAVLLDAQIHSNVLPWIEDNGQIIEVTREVQKDTNVLELADWVKKVSAFINLVEEKVDAEKALEEFIKDVFEDED